MNSDFPESGPPPIHKPPSSGWEVIGFLFLAMLPVPIGLLSGPLRLFDIAQGDKSVNSSPLVGFIVLTLIFCVTGGIGMCGGFNEGKWKARIAGVAVGLAMCTVEASIVLLAGCCQGLSHVH